jgi:hypothetical protein
MLMTKPPAWLAFVSAPMAPPLVAPGGGGTAKVPSGLPSVRTGRSVPVAEKIARLSRTAACFVGSAPPPIGRVPAGEPSVLDR